MRKPMIIIIIVLGVIALVLLAAWIGVGVYSIAGIEQPPYEVIESRDGYEIRQYAPQLAAEVEVDGDFTAATNRGFRALADYIFGNNTAPGEDVGAESIAMTAPVIEQEAVSSPIPMTSPVVERSADANKRVITFIMPSAYTLDTIPRPNNPEVKLVEIPARRCAVLRFSGSMNDDVAAEKKALLSSYLERDGLEGTGPPMLAQYNPPWTPPFMRRNEVLVELR